MRLSEVKPRQIPVRGEASHPHLIGHGRLKSLLLDPLQKGGITGWRNA
jgi:hypothetical protein